MFLDTHLARTLENAIRYGLNCIEGVTLNAIKQSQKGLFDSAYSELYNYVNNCAAPTFNILPIVNLTGPDRTHLYLPPVYSDESCNIISLGIKKSLDAEIQIKKLYPRCRFLGIDPNESIGKLFENQLSGIFINGRLTMDEESNNVTRHNFKNFLDNFNDDRPIDVLFMDINGQEFSLLEYIADNADALPPICQINVELHFPHQHPPRGRNILETLHTMSAKGRFLLLNMFPIGPFYRLFIINVADIRCEYAYLGYKINLIY
ncbi:hypothetical protein FO519_008595 [Halicephalobus sp. NKZ332]|nr:hypothetical protein FO519_008595 [Halicephalobus sp. NKZ332]